MVQQPQDGSFGSLVSKGTTTLDGQVFVDTDSGSQPFYITRGWKHNGSSKDSC